MTHFTLLTTLYTIRNHNFKLREGLTKTIAYFASLDLRRYRKPTKHTAHKNTEADAAADAAKASAAVP